MERVDAKYVFLDVVDYADNTIENQFAIIEKLQSIVKEAVRHVAILSSICYLPTGDGMCIVLENESQDDKHLLLAIKILELLSLYNKSNEVKFEVRIGINENKDIIYSDINDRKNYAGRGINYAQRVMSFADGVQIMAGSAVYEKLADTNAYHNKFKGLSVEIKSDKTIQIYQYVDTTKQFVNSRRPSISLQSNLRANVYYAE